MAIRRVGDWFVEEYDDKEDRETLWNKYLDLLDDATQNDIIARVKWMVDGRMQWERLKSIHQRKIQLKRILEEINLEKKQK